MSTDSLDFPAELKAALGDAYVIERELTGSGMSRVFVATERALDRKVVVKVLPPELAAGVNRERFRREIQLAAQLQHPHIVPLHAAGVRGDLLYFTMPFIEGESLRHALHDGVRFSPREVVRILHDVSDALAYAHARGVIHRDIKPGNVLRSGAHAVVTDFGVAKAISAAMPSAGMTTSGMAIGTPAYMAPEQLAGDPAADHRVDIYALGLLAYELLSGDAPFKSPSPQETMAAQLTRVPEPISRQREDVPPVFATLISRCLAKNPNDRPQTAAEVTAILDELETTSGGVASYRASNLRTAGILVALMVVAVVVALFAWRRGTTPPPTAVVVPPPDTAARAPAASLTHDDSLAIARAVQKKIAEQQGAVRARAESTQKALAKTQPAKTSVSSPDLATLVNRLADSLRLQIERAVLDSVARQRGLLRFSFRTDGPGSDSSGRREPRPGPGRGVVVEIPRPPSAASALSAGAFAERLANLGPPRRLFVSYPRFSRSRAFLQAASDSLVDSLRHALGRVPRYVLVDTETVRNILEKTRTIEDISSALNVELFASIYASVLPDSSVTWQITARDLSAHSAYRTRAASITAPRQAPLSGADAIIARALRFLQEIDRAPRRTNPPEH